MATMDRIVANYAALTAQGDVATPAQANVHHAKSVGQDQGATYGAFPVVDNAV